MSDNNVKTARSSPAGIWLLLGVLGVVYGDIGTSPLYALRICFSLNGAAAINPTNVLGIVSLILWALIIIISLKYCLVVLRADNKGEGGILSLMTLARTGMKSRFGMMSVFFIGIFGVSLLFGDSLITPVISVLSAVEGLNTLSPFFAKAILPISMVILITLFYFQNKGTGKIGSVFGPVMILWFIVLTVLGVLSIIRTPIILSAFNPAHAASFIIHNPLQAFVMLGGVFLALTGGEALYSDMGHFGKAKIRQGWFFIVLPALAVNYLGQGALLIRSPDAIQGLFYNLAPKWMLIPYIILATMATIIASQAVISAAFSLAKQAVQLGFLPRLHIVHTSEDSSGQIYVPLVNNILLVGTILLLLAFRSSDNLAGAYGVAVSLDMLFTTILLARVSRNLWRWSVPLVVSLIGFFLVFDVSFLVSNLGKFQSGGFLPLCIAFVLFMVMITWSSERRRLYAVIARSGLDEDYLLKEIKKHKPYRPDSIGIYLSGNPTGVPRTLMHNFKHNQVIHKTVVFLTVTSRDAPSVDESVRIEVKELGQGFYRINLNYGFMEKMDVPAALRRVNHLGLRIDPLKATYFLGKENLMVLKRPFPRNISRSIFAFLSKNARNASDFYNLPLNRVIELGIQMEI